jgi:hypothetical protein
VGKHLKLIAAVGFLTVQLLVPIWPTFVHPSEVRTDFAWDMFATRRDCKPCHLLESVDGKPTERVGWGRLYRSTFHAARTRNAARLPLAAREVCRRHELAGRKASVYIDCKCRWNGQPEVYDLDHYGKDYCTPEAEERFGE